MATVSTLETGYQRQEKPSPLLQGNWLRICRTMIHAVEGEQELVTEVLSGQVLRTPEPASEAHPHETTSFIIGNVVLQGRTINRQSALEAAQPHPDIVYVPGSSEWHLRAIAAPLPSALSA